MWPTILKTLLKYKGYVLSFIFVFVVYLSTGWYMSKVREESYGQGFSAANSAWEQKASDYDKQVENFRSENYKLNSLLDDQIDYSNSLQEKIKHSVSEDLRDYKKSEEGSRSTIGDGFVDIYNKSLGG